MAVKKAILIGCGIAAPALAIFLKRAGVEAVIYEALQTFKDSDGAFLGISPNGLNIIKEFMPLEKMLIEFTPGSIKLFNEKNKNIGIIDNTCQKDLFGAETVQLKRGLLNKALRCAAVENGIKIEMGKKLTALYQTNKNVTAFFEDGTQVTADILIGCDGMRSATREALFPGGVKPAYTGLLSTAGFTRLDDAKQHAGAIRMTFGEKGFFAYAVANTGEVWWFNNIVQDEEPARNELNWIEQVRIKNILLDMHQNDPAPIADIIKQAANVQAYPVYDIPFLARWHKGRVCLTGDAAHAMAPHTGQGASLALEDAIVLAKCIRDIPGIEYAFEKFQSLRQARTQKIVKQARKVGNLKKGPNKLQRFFRDLLLPFFVKFEVKKMAWVFAYKVDWNEKIQ